jgi:hypothetical protein
MVPTEPSTIRRKPAYSLRATSRETRPPAANLRASTRRHNMNSDFEFTFADGLRAFFPRGTHHASRGVRKLAPTSFVTKEEES